MNSALETHHRLRTEHVVFCLDRVCVCVCVVGEVYENYMLHVLTETKLSTGRKQLGYLYDYNLTYDRRVVKLQTIFRQMRIYLEIKQSWKLDCTATHATSIGYEHVSPPKNRIKHHWINALTNMNIFIFIEKE